MSLLAPMVNLTLLGFFLQRSLKVPLREFAAQRASQVRADLQNAETQLRTATQQLHTASVKLAGLEQEIKSLHQEAERTGRLAHQKTTEAAQRLAARLLEQGRFSSQLLLEDFQAALKQRLAMAALTQATQLITQRLDRGQQQAWRQQFAHLLPRELAKGSA